MSKAKELLDVIEAKLPKNFPPEVEKAEELTDKEANLMSIKGKIYRFGDHAGWRYFQSSDDTNKYFKMKL